MASLNVGGLGEYLREQRRSAQLSLRQLADAAGVSNPYLSQIERGLRKPSAEILQQLAKALRISAETLYVQAGILDERERDGLEVRAAILADPDVAKISVVGVGMRSHAGVASTMFATLAAKGINIQVISTSEIKVSVLIAADYTELAVRALHTAYGLDA